MLRERDSSSLMELESHSGNPGLVRRCVRYERKNDMSTFDEVEGRIGDVSGRIGDVSGRIGDVSGRIGDVSGVDGKMGDVSGDSTLQEVKDFLMQDRGSDRLNCLEGKIRRVENEVLGIARWLDARLRLLEARSTTLQSRLDLIESTRLVRIEKHLVEVDKRLEALEHRCPK